MSYINQTSFLKAIKYIQKNMDQPFTLQDLATDIGLSLSSLKRLFLDSINQSAGGFIRRLRMEQAFRSIRKKEESILEIALSAGFEDHSSFTRAFKNTFGYAPSCARQKLNIIQELESITLEEPEYLELDSFQFQGLTKKGTYFDAPPQAWMDLKSHLSRVEFDDDFSGTFIAIGHDNPHDGEIDHDKVRFSAGVALTKTDLHIEKLTISQGVYAKFRFVGKVNNLGLAYHYIYGPWLAKSDRKIRHDIPTFLMFDRFPDIFQDQTIALYVPLEP